MSIVPSTAVLQVARLSWLRQLARSLRGSTPSSSWPSTALAISSPRPTVKALKA